jgi:hypothetical protein
MRIAAAGLLIAAVLVCPAVALDCAQPAGWQLAELARGEAHAPGARDALIHTAVANILAEPVAFEGRLVRETVQQSKPNTDLRETLLEFRDVFWLKGPSTGLRESKVFVIRADWCDGGCRDPRRVVRHSVPPHPPGTVFLADWALRSSQADYRRRFGVSVRYTNGICSRGTATFAGQPEVVSALEQTLQQMRAAANDEARRLVRPTRRAR